MKSSTPFLIAASMAVLAAITIGFYLAGSPGEARLQNLDEKRTAALRNIATRIQYYYKSHKALPPDLPSLNLREREIKDPVTQLLYEYKATGADGYQLCTAFDTQPDEEQSNAYPDYGACQTPWWRHPRGHYCYTVSMKDCHW